MDKKACWNCGRLVETYGRTVPTLIGHAHPSGGFCKAGNTPADRNPGMRCGRCSMLIPPETLTIDCPEGVCCCDGQPAPALCCQHGHAARKASHDRGDESWECPLHGVAT